MTTRYEDNSAAFLEYLVREIGPTVEAMGDLVLESIRGHIQRGSRPSSPGEGPTSHAPEFDLWDSWHRGRVRRRRDRVQCVVFSTARSADGKVSISLAQEHGNDVAAPRVHIAPGIAQARSQITSIARAGLR